MDYFQKVTVNDHLHSNHVIYKGFFGNGKYSEPRLVKISDSLRKLRTPKDSYFADEFGGRYFSIPDALQIAAIRERLHQLKNDLNDREFNLLLASLIYSVDRAARTVGHYEAFLKSYSIRTEFRFDLIKPFNNASVDIHQQDANSLARRVRGDVAYVDPPYNSRQYSRFYHVLETLTKWDRPKLAGVARKPPSENSSLYCKTSAPTAFADLIENLDSRLIVVSYNNTYDSRSHSSRNKISLQQIRATLESRGKVSSKSIRLNHFNAGKSDLADHREYIFVCKTSK
jgi:adenine-specific DNA-methyltransferase